MKLYDQRTKTSSFILMVSPSPFIIPNCLTIVPSSSQTFVPLSLHHPKLSYHCTFIIPNCYHCTFIIPNCLTIVPSSSQAVSPSNFINFKSPFSIPNCLTKSFHHPKLSHHCTFIIPYSQQVSFFPFKSFSFCSKLSHHMLHG